MQEQEPGQQQAGEGEHHRSARPGRRGCGGQATAHSMGGTRAATPRQGAGRHPLERDEAEREDLEGERPGDAAQHEPAHAGGGQVGGPPEQEDAGGQAGGDHL
jgi:hypothetical protein